MPQSNNPSIPFLPNYIITSYIPQRNLRSSNKQTFLLVVPLPPSSTCTLQIRCVSCVKSCVKLCTIWTTQPSCVVHIVHNFTQLYTTDLQCTYGDRAFASAAPVLWNKLPDKLRADTDTSIVFMKSLKTYPFSYYSCKKVLVKRIENLFIIMRYINVYYY